MSALQIIHENGCTYNDLKPENIMISTSPSSENINVKLIDYGFVNNFMQPNGKTISPLLQEEYFRGNILFASKRHL